MTQEPYETLWRSREMILRRQWERFRELLSTAIPANPFWTARFENAGVRSASITSLRDLARIPLTTKQNLVDDQRANAPYGSNLTFGPESYTRLHQTSGTTGRPLRWLDTPASWNWLLNCWRQIYHLAGVCDGDRIFLPFSFGPFIGFWAAFEGAAHLNALRVAGGGMSSELRLHVLRENAATVICCTPTYALRLGQVARQTGINLAECAVHTLIVAGEPGGSIPSTRARIEQEWGARVIDHWGMTEVGSLAVESVANPRHLYVLETECIAEILSPDTLEPVSAGEQGELVVTNLGRTGSPLIRYRTGDLVRTATTTCPQGYELLRLDGGILGRADDMVTIRGNNVFPSSVEAVLREFREVDEYRVEVQSRRSMSHLRIQVEAVKGTRWEELVARLDRAIRNRLGFQAELAKAEPGSLPRYELKGRRFFRSKTPADGGEAGEPE